MGSLPPGENERLRTTLQDVVALSTLSARWLGLDKDAIGAALLDILVQTFEAEAAFVLMRGDGQAKIIEAARDERLPGFAQWAKTKLGVPKAPASGALEPDLSSKTLPKETFQGSDGQIPVAIVRAELDSQQALLAIASRKKDFPSELDALLLSVALNQAVISVHVSESQHRLASSEQTFRALSAASPIGIFLTDLQGRAIYTNARCQAICGFTAEEALGEGWERFVDPDERDEVIREWTEAAQSGREFERNICWAHRDKKNCSTHVRATPVVSDDGQRFGYVGTVEDISEQKKMAEALSESEQQFQTLANSIPNLAWMANPDGWIFWYNQRWFEYTGTTPAQMEGWGWQSVHDPATLPSVLERWQGSIREGKPFDMVFPLRGADGVFRPFLTRVVPVIDASGKVTRWFGSNTDVSELQRAQQALEDSEERFRTIAETASDAVFLIDENSQILFANGSAVRIFGHPLEDMVGHSLTMVMPHYLRHLHEASLARYNHTGKRHLDWSAVELPGLHKNGAEIPLELSFGESLKDGKRLFTGFARDITERKRMQETLLAGEKAAATGRMAATMAHEINNPLEVVTNILYLFDKNPSLDAQGRKFVNMLSDEIARVTYITKGTLDLYRGAKTPVRFLVSKELDEVIEQCAPRLQALHLVVEKRYSSPGEVEGYPIEIRQVFADLITNAMEASEGRAGRIVLEISETRAPEIPGMQKSPGSLENSPAQENSGAYVRVLIADDGPGIAEDVRNRLFEPFVSTKGTRGTGLGLWVSRGIIHKHGGTIEVLPKATGETFGTQILITLPQHQDRAITANQ